MRPFPPSNLGTLLCPLRITALVEMATAFSTSLTKLNLENGSDLELEHVINALDLNNEE